MPQTTKTGKKNVGSILVLDDDFDISMLIKISLQKIEYNVFCFTDPLLALEDFRINHQIYSLVISDVMMPIMNGFEFAREYQQDKARSKGDPYYCI